MATLTELKISWPPGRDKIEIKDKKIKIWFLKKRQFLMETYITHKVYHQNQNKTKKINRDYFYNIYSMYLFVYVLIRHKAYEQIKIEKN